MEKVSTFAIVCMAVACVASFLLPILLMIWLKKKKGARVFAFFVGCAVMLSFALIMESAVHQLVLNSALGQTIQSSVWLYALYGGLMAALFEECGRLFAFKTFLKRLVTEGRDANALMYGAGHGGLEAIVLCGVTMIGNLVLALMINDGQTAEILGMLPEDQRGQMEGMMQTLTATGGATYLLSLLERGMAIVLQMSLSVFVWFAAKNRSKLYLFGVAFGVHFAVDAITAVLSKSGAPILVTEAVLAVLTAAVAVLARKVWRTEREQLKVEN